ncbi:hypothetical protein NC99_06190 [Sunxiuqinia dokdonensis]|uniref:Uncharacterized protein n=1 Tax=Sunxiuqinia dokdonensis TaxID=1409788 RepID=A0A0L8VDB9_9BACT|nr:hypothetical protein NC99_06190 [Sunxiuqinia dokdonensis]
MFDARFWSRVVFMVLWLKPSGNGIKWVITGKFGLGYKFRVKG